MTDGLVRVGLDQLDDKWPGRLKGSRVGLLVHPASVNKDLEHSVNLFVKSKKIALTALFGPQHGIRGETQDNMIEWEGFIDPFTGLPVFSLYGHTRKPERWMLKDIDVLAIDVQDVGARYYTFIWTMDLCLQACMETGKSVVLLDRPNPIGGRITEGPVLDIEFASFVGQRTLPVRHAMTIGEIGSYIRDEFYPSLDFHVVRMTGWKRKFWFNETGLPWVMPSPNMPTPDTATVYAGMCLIEATNIGEGRGTTRPFEIFGAPFIEPELIVRHLNTFKLPGVVFRPLYFQPTFQKHAGKLCGGAQLHVVDRVKFKSFKTGVAVLKSVHDLYPDFFEWKRPPYEYEVEKMPVDILAGTDRLRKNIENGEDLDRMEESWQEQCREFDKAFRRKYLFYK
jgi:uncharacterized protein YbbC (DUF1343 family)